MRPYVQAFPPIEKREKRKERGGCNRRACREEKGGRLGGKGKIGE